MHAVYNCPRCGKPDSAWGGTFCGSCEAAYWAEQARWQAEVIADANAAMDSCDCAEGCCSSCLRNAARICEAHGDHDGAYRLLNI